jgi:hypothetical protein
VAEEGVGVRARAARFVLGGLGAAAAILLVVELSLGAIHFGRPTIPDPCTAKPDVREGGIGGAIDSAVQRFALSGLNGAACELNTTSEELVLSFVPSSGEKPVRWDRETIERALRSGFERAARDTVGGGFLGDVLAAVLRRAVADPIAWLLGQVAS